MPLLTRRYPFCASHRLHLASLSDDENRALFGKCNNPYGHGHNYVLHVTVRGEPNPESGLVLQREAMDRAVREAAIARIDHRDMNADVPEFAVLNPTTENLARVVADWLCRAWRERFPAGPRLSRITIEETGRNTFALDMEPALDREPTR